MANLGEVQGIFNNLSCEYCSYIVLPWTDSSSLKPQEKKNLAINKGTFAPG